MMIKDLNNLLKFWVLFHIVAEEELLRQLFANAIEPIVVWINNKMLAFCMRLNRRKWHAGSLDGQTWVCMLLVFSVYVVGDVPIGIMSIIIRWLWPWISNTFHLSLIHRTFSTTVDDDLMSSFINFSDIVCKLYRAIFLSNMLIIVSLLGYLYSTRMCKSARH